MNGVVTLVFSSLFKRERKMYSFSDWKLLVPLTFQRVMNLVLSFTVWSVPILFIFKEDAISNWFGFAMTFGPPIGFTILVSKPQVIFNNKNFYVWVWCHIKYMLEPKYYTDWKPCNINNGDHVKCDFTIWLGDPQYNDYWDQGKRKLGRRKEKKA